MSTSPPTIITLLHGTFANNAPWTQESSPLAAALREQVNGEVYIKSMNWSGRNFHLARYRAAAQLRAHLRSIAKQHPGCKQFVVAHSHGGNVGMYAMNNSEIRRLVSGLVTLSTPFILCRPRVIPPIILPALFAMVSSALLLYLLNSYTEYIYFILAGFGTLLFALRAAEVWISRMVLGRKDGTSAEIHRALGKSFLLAPLTYNKLLIVRAPGDEASAGLGAAAFGTWLFGTISGWLGGIYRFSLRVAEFHQGASLAKLSIWSAGFLSAGIGLFAVWVNFFVPVEFGFLSACVFGMGVTMVCISISIIFNALGIWAFLLQCFYVMLVTPLYFICSLFSAAFGLDITLLGTWFEFSVEVSPVGRFSVLSLSAPTAGGLWHSLPYLDSEAFDAIVKWINEYEEVMQPLPEMITEYKMGG